MSLQPLSRKNPAFLMHHKKGLNWEYVILSYLILHDIISSYNLVHEISNRPLRAGSGSHRSALDDSGQGRGP